MNDVRLRMHDALDVFQDYVRRESADNIMDGLKLARNYALDMVPEAMTASELNSRKVLAFSYLMGVLKATDFYVPAEIDAVIKALEVEKVS